MRRRDFLRFAAVVPAAPALAAEVIRGGDPGPDDRLTESMAELAIRSDTAAEAIRVLSAHVEDLTKNSLVLKRLISSLEEGGIIVPGGTIP